MELKKIIKTVISIVLMFVMFLPNTVKTFANEDDSFTLRVGYWQNYGISQDVNGNLYGYIYDYMQKICVINNWKVEFIECDWGEGLEKLANGSLDAFGPLQKTDEREEIYDFPKTNMGYEYGTLFATNNNYDVFYNDLKSIDGKVLGTVGDSYYVGVIEEYCKKNDISLKIKTIPDTNEINRQFENGEIDLRISGSMLTHPNSKIILSFSIDEIYFPTTKGNKKVLDGFNTALDEIMRENLYYHAELYDKYYTKPSLVNKAFTAEEKAFIDEAPVIKIGYEMRYKPLEYFDEKTKSAKGVTIDLLHKIEDYSGLKFEFVPTEDFGQASEMLQKGEIQLMSGLVGGEHFSEVYGLEQTLPIYQTKLAFITKNGYDFNNKDIILAVPENWWGIRNLIKQNYSVSKVKTYKTVDKCLDAVINGEANVSVQNTLAADEFLKLYKYQQLSINNMNRGDLPICIGAPNNTSKVFMSILNKSIGSISDDMRNQAIYEHTIGITYEPTFSEKVRYNAPLLFICICTFLVVLYLFSLHSRNELNELAYYDLLTGEMNLNKFKTEVKKITRFSKETYAIMVFDIDKFKSINDIYGYDFGDQMLIFVANEFHNTFKSSELFCKGAADKFYVFFKYENCEKITNEFHMLAKKTEDFHFDNMVNCKIVLSGGVCKIEHDDTNIISIIDRANIATKQVKNSHISDFAYYEASMYDKINREKGIENTMKAALDNNEFIIYLQPKIELSSRKAVGAEALVRWLQQDNRLVSPSEFIPLFEENGFIVELDFYVLRKVCTMLERWNINGRELFTVSVNLSRRHLENKNTAKILHDVVSEYSIDPKFIEVELTESAFDNCNVSSITALFDELHSYGFTVSVDDFGAGYSSLALLKDLPIDVLKIDKSFFDCIDGCKNDKMQLLLESVISLSQKLDIKTVSEGVETIQQVRLLAELGCDLVQGFYFARPMPIEQLENDLDTDALYN